MMAQYLLALLGNRDPLTAMLGAGMGLGGPESGRMGDYVFNQEGPLFAFQAMTMEV